MEANNPAPRRGIRRAHSEKASSTKRLSTFRNDFESTRRPFLSNSNRFSDDDVDSPRGALPPSPSASIEEAKKQRARKEKVRRLFKKGVLKIVKANHKDMDIMAKKGSLYVMDAFAGRLQHGMAVVSTKKWYIFAAFRLQISVCWMWTIIASSIAHSLLVFLEPRPGKGPEDATWVSARTLRSLEGVFIAIYALDVALKVAYMGVKNYLKKPWQQLMLGIVFILAVDASGVVGVRFARALRPAVLSLRTRSIRRFYAVVGNMMPGFFRVCIPVIFFLLLSASYAALSFGRAKAEFENPAAAGYAVWILMVCADNYEALVNNPSEHPAYIPFVVMVILVGSMFLLSLLLGVTYDVFIEHTTAQVKSERLKELKGLNAAFAVMDSKGTGEITMVVWDRFLTHLMPRTTKEERVIYFQIASGFSNRLDVLGFMELRQVLSYSFVNVSALEREGKRQRREKMPPWLVQLLLGMEGMLDLKWWKNVVSAIVLLDCLLLPHSIPYQGPEFIVSMLTTMCGAVLLLDQAFQLAEWVRLGSARGPLLRLPGRSSHTKMAGVAVILHTLVTGLLHCPAMLSFVCSFSSSARTSFLPSSSSTAAFDDTFSGSFSGEDGGGCRLNEGVVFEWEEEGYQPSMGGGMCVEVDQCTDCLLMLAYTLRLLRCWRLVTLRDTLHDHVNTFFSVVPVFAQTLSFALIVTYAFAMVAMQFFSDKAGAFCNASTSLRTTLQLFVGVDFSAVVEETVEAVGPSALVFFVAYHVVAVLIVFNLLTAIMIQLYGEALNEKSRQGTEEQCKVVDELQRRLYVHSQKLSVWRRFGRQILQDASNLNITKETKLSNGREARRVLGSGAKSQKPTVDELKRCQPYAKVDLLRTLEEKTRADNNPSFERSLYQRFKATEGNIDVNSQIYEDGDAIYYRGDPHHACFFVNKGVVRLEMANGTVNRKETGEMFGEEALVENLPMSGTAIAEGEVECVSMDRATFTETHGTLENLGLIFLRLQRSGSFSVIDAPSSVGSREGGRRSTLFSSRSSKTGLSGMGSSSHFDSCNPIEPHRQERLRNRRNAPSSQSGRKNSQFGTLDEVSTGGGKDKTGSKNRLSIIANSRSNSGSRNDVAASGNSTGPRRGEGGSGNGPLPQGGGNSEREPNLLSPSVRTPDVGVVGKTRGNITSNDGSRGEGDAKKTYEKQNKPPSDILPPTVLGLFNGKSNSSGTTVEPLLGQVDGVTPSDSRTWGRTDRGVVQGNSSTEIHIFTRSSRASSNLDIGARQTEHSRREPAETPESVVIATESGAVGGEKGGTCSISKGLGSIHSHVLDKPAKAKGGGDGSAPRVGGVGEMQAPFSSVTATGACPVAVAAAVREGLGAGMASFGAGLDEAAVPDSERWALRAMRQTKGTDQREQPDDTGNEGVEVDNVEGATTASYSNAGLSLLEVEKADIDSSTLSPDLSPSEAPSSRKQHMMKTRGSVYSRREASFFGESNDPGSQISTWSTRSPSPTPTVNADEY